MKNCLFGTLILTRNTSNGYNDCIGYIIVFDGSGVFSFSGSGFVQKVLIFGVCTGSLKNVKILTIVF